MKNYFFGLMMVLAISILIAQCNLAPKGINLNLKGPALEKLSSYGFFTGKMKDLIPSTARLVPYDLINPLFTDYAFKKRFIYVPDGKQVAYNDTDVLAFPVGSAIVKVFYYPSDFRKPTENIRILETRLLIHRENGWEALPYVWNDKQTDAELKVAGASFPVHWIDETGTKQEVNYSVPNKNQCKGCHWNREAMTPIGPKVRNMNKVFTYAEGDRNQLEHFAGLGILKGLDCPGTSPKLAKWDDPKSGSLQDRAIGYLEANCAHCHRAEGPAATSGLLLNSLVKDPTSLGLFKTPVASGIGSGPLLYDIVPGNADSSIIHYRMNSLHPGIMMPELGRHMIHKEGVALIREWINKMDKSNPILFN